MAAPVAGWPGGSDLCPVLPVLATVVAPDLHTLLQGERLGQDHDATLGDGDDGRGELDVGDVLGPLGVGAVRGACHGGGGWVGGDAERGGAVLDLAVGDGLGAGEDDLGGVLPWWLLSSGRVGATGGGGTGRAEA